MRAPLVLLALVLARAVPVLPATADPILLGDGEADFTLMASVADDPLSTPPVTDDAPASTRVPEPVAISLIGLGAIMAVMYLKRRGRQVASSSSGAASEVTASDIPPAA